MRSLSFSLLSSLLLATSVQAQSFDPWAGYEVRDIRELRNESHKRRERLRELARQDKERRDAVRSIAPTRRPEVSSSQRPQRKPFLEVSDEDVVYEVKRGPIWTKPPLQGTPEERAIALKETLAKSPVKPQSQLFAFVSLENQELTLTDDGVVIAVWPVSTGKKTHATTKGDFGVQFLSRNHKSSLYNDAPMPCSIFFNGDEAIHGTEAVGMLGRVASHGCVRLETKNACELYDLVAKRGKQSLKIAVR